MNPNELKQEVSRLQKVLDSLLKALWLKPDLKPLVKRKAQAVLDEMQYLGLPMRIVEGYRSPQRQDELYAQGRTKPGAIVTNAKGGQSLHNYGVAVDMCFRQYGYNATEAQWQTYGNVAKRFGFEYGGDWTSFKDRPHIEMKLGYSLTDFQQGNVDYKKYL